VIDIVHFDIQDVSVYSKWHYIKSGIASVVGEPQTVFQLWTKPFHLIIATFFHLLSLFLSFLLLACYVPNVAKEEYMRSV